MNVINIKLFYNLHFTFFFFMMYVYKYYIGLYDYIYMCMNMYIYVEAQKLMAGIVFHPFDAESLIPLHSLVSVLQRPFPCLFTVEIAGIVFLGGFQDPNSGPLTSRPVLFYNRCIIILYIPLFMKIT